MADIGNKTGCVIGNDGNRLYGMDAELHLKREAQRDPEFELEVAKWIQNAVEEPLADLNDLWVSLRSGVILCKLANKILPNSIPRFAKTKLLPLVEMDNIQLYLKACWSMGVPSGDFFIVSDLYHNKSIHQVIQNIVSLSRVAPSLGFSGPALVAGNTGKDRVKQWATVEMGGQMKHVDDLVKGTPEEQITQLSLELGEVKHENGKLKSEIQGLKATMKEMRDQHRSEKDRLGAEKKVLTNRLKKFAPIDDGGEGEEGSMALKALELTHKEQLAEITAELNKEKANGAALEKKHEELKSKYSSASAELSKLRFSQKQDSGKLSGEVKKPAWMLKVAEKKAKAEAERAEKSSGSGSGGGGAGGSIGKARGRTRTKTIMAQSLPAPSQQRTPISDMLSVPKPSGGGPPPVDIRTRGDTILKEEVVYRGRLNTMMQVKTSKDGEAEADTESGFFFNADSLDSDGLEYLSEQVEIIFSNTPIEDDASTILNEMLFADSGRRTFTFVLKEKLKQFGFQKVSLDTGPFLQVLSLVNSTLTGMQLDNQMDYIAMTFLLGASRAIYTTGSRSKMEEFLADHLRDHSVWSDVSFWEQHYWDVVGKSFKKKFAHKTLAVAMQDGWSDEHARFLCQFTASFSHEMSKWSMTEDQVTEFLTLVFDRLEMPQKYRDLTKQYINTLAKRHTAKQTEDSQRMRHVSMVMSTAQAQRIRGGLKKADGTAVKKQDTNILQGWLKRKVHVMWITEWVDQVGQHLNFREFKGGGVKRITVNLNQLDKVEVRKDDKAGRTIFIQAGDMKITVAPIKDADEEVDYWVDGLKRMKSRFNLAPGTKRAAAAIPKRMGANRSGGPPKPTFNRDNSKDSSSPELKKEEVAHVYKMGDMVWTQFEEDLLWYRGVVYLIDEGIHKVVFIEYGNTQDCELSQVRPIGDAAFLAILDKKLEEVTSPESIDKNRPLTVQIPTVVVEEMRRGGRSGTIINFDPKSVLEQQKEEFGGSEKSLPTPPPKKVPEPEPEPEEDGSIVEEDGSLIIEDGTGKLNLRGSALFDNLFDDDDDDDDDEDFFEEEEAPVVETPKVEEMDAAARRAALVKQKLAERRSARAGSSTATKKDDSGSLEQVRDGRRHTLERNSARRGTLERGSARRGTANASDPTQAALTAQRVKERLEARKAAERAAREKAQQDEEEEGEEYEEGEDYEDEEVDGMQGVIEDEDDY